MGTSWLAAWASLKGSMIVERLVESCLVVVLKSGLHFNCVKILCRNVVWLPGSVSEALATTVTCSTFSPGPIYMIQFKFRRLNIPPDYNVEHLGCIGGCDPILRQLVEICGTGSRSNSNVPGRGQGHTSSSSSGQQSNSRNRGTWLPGNSSTPYTSQSTRNHDARQSREATAEDGESSVPCASCGAACNLRTANTSANRGRKFYSCQTQGCNFFVWEDNASSAGTVSRGRAGRSASNSSRQVGRGRGRGRHRSSAGRENDMAFISATGEPISGRCFTCGEPSHFANACPSRGR